MTTPKKPRAKRVGVRVECALCLQQKQPRGRSGGLERRYCDYECPGYSKAPLVGSLWPGETDADFGYSYDAAGTEPVRPTRALTGLTSKHISLRPADELRLERLQSALGCSASEAIRRAVAEALERRT